MLIVIIVLALLGFLVWAITNYIPMSPGFKNMIYLVAIIFAIFYILKAFGLLSAVTRSLS